MKNFIKTILIIILSMNITQNLIYSYQDDDFFHPPGLESVKLQTGSKEQNIDPRDEGNYFVNIENLKKFTEIEQWMDDVGLRFNDDNLRRIFERAFF